MSDDSQSKINFTEEDLNFIKNYSHFRNSITHNSNFIQGTFDTFKPFGQRFGYNFRNYSNIGSYITLKQLGLDFDFKGFEYLNGGFAYVSAPPENVEEVTVKEDQEKDLSVILKETEKIKGIITDIHKEHSNLFIVKPRDFEKVIAELLRNKGYEVELTKQTHDGGFDIMALKNLGGFKNKYLIECKRWGENNPVGIEIIRSFADVIKENNANKGIICATSYFSPEARNREKLTPYLLELKDRIDILEWVSEYISKK